MSSLVPTCAELHLFDVHTCLQPLDNCKLFKSKFDFLSSPVKYNDRYDADDEVTETEHFQSIKPLMKSKIEASYFWKKLPSSKAWYAQRPLVAIPAADLSVRLEAEDLGLNLPVQSEVYLWPWGWSTNLLMKIEGEVSLSALAELTASFKSQPSRPRSPLKAFKLDGKPCKPSEIFKRLGEWISLDIYDAYAAGQAKIVVDRHFILSILASSGKALPYDSISGRRIDVNDRALLHSILLGFDVSLEDLEVLEKYPRRFMIPFKDRAFALTHYDHGSVLDLRELKPAEESAENSKREEFMSGKCLTRNVKNCAALAFGLAAIQKAVQKNALSCGVPEKWVGKIIKSACDIREHYMDDGHVNPLWKNYFGILNREQIQWPQAVDSDSDNQY